MRSIMMNAALPLAACATAAAEPPVQGATSGFVCRNADLAAFAGRPATSELGSEMLRATGARTLRWVAKGMMVTMDYREDRLTVWLAADNRVERANCG